MTKHILMIFGFLCWFFIVHGSQDDSKITNSSRLYALLSDWGNKHHAQWTTNSLLNGDICKDIKLVASNILDSENSSPVSQPLTDSALIMVVDCSATVLKPCMMLFSLFFANIGRHEESSKNLSLLRDYKEELEILLNDEEQAEVSLKDFLKKCDRIRAERCAQLQVRMKAK